jgi:hypothetical protein
MERASRPAGLQLGGQFRMSLASLGTTTTTALGFAPTVGIYIWPLGENGPMFTLDAGPELALTNGSADFRVTSFSNTFGLSIHQYF